MIATTPNDLYAWINTTLLKRIAQVRRAPLNRIALPKGDFAIFQPIGAARRAHRPVSSVDKVTGIITESQDMVQHFQVDIYGPLSAENSRAYLSDILSPTQAAAWKAAGFGVVPPAEIMPFDAFVNDEDQYEKRWILKFGVLYTQAYVQDNTAFDHIDVGLPIT